MPDWVLTRNGARNCIAMLREQSVHPYFPAYLHLRQRAAAEARLTNLRPDWDELSKFLQVRGAPSDRPHFRPFTLGTVAGDQEWLNPNLAGSYAPSSLRMGQPPLKVVELSTVRGSFNLRPKHWELAREYLLGDERLPLAAVSGFMLRDFAFENYPTTPGYDELEAAFAETFGYDDQSGPVELDFLYDRTPHATNKWFEQFMGPA